MSAADNKKLVAGVFEQLSTGNTNAFRDAMSDDFRWVLPGNWSWSGVWEPKRVVLEELTGPLMAQFASYRSEADEILADGDRVVVRARSRAATKRGHPYDQDYCFVFRVSGGKLTEVVEYCDSSLAERVLDPPARVPMRLTGVDRRG
jgi:uncharacterized protein